MMIQRCLPAVLLLLQLLCCCTPQNKYHSAGNGQEQSKFYVALTGSDNNPGTIVKPFKSLQAALNRVAAAKSDQVSIYLRAGVHAPGKTIEITPALLNRHQLEIAAYNQEAAVISGAQKITPNGSPIGAGWYRPP